MPDMPPGPELNAKVAEAKGWHRYEGYDIPQWCAPEPGLIMPVYDWKPSTDIAQAMELVEESCFAKLEYAQAHNNDVDDVPDLWIATLGVLETATYYQAVGDTAPHAICLTYLKAKGAA